MGNLNRTAEQIATLLDKRLKGSDKEIAKLYANLLNDIRKELSRIYESYEEDGVLTYAEMAKYDRLNKFLTYVNGLLVGNYKHLKETIYDVLGESYLEGYYLTAWAVETDSQTKLNYSTVTPETITQSIGNPVSGLKLSDRLKKNRSDIIYKIQQEVTQGLVKGESYKNMATRLVNALEGDANKAVRIVRTEGHRVTESAKHDSAVHATQNGVIMIKEWNTMEDERVRPGRGIGKKNAKNTKNHKVADHIMLDGEKLPIDGTFNDGLSEGPSPGQLGAAGSDINCRCFLTYEIDRIEKPSDKELENMVFDTWKKERLR